MMTIWFKHLLVCIGWKARPSCEWSIRGRVFQVFQHHISCHPGDPVDVPLPYNAECSGRPTECPAKPLHPTSTKTHFSASSGAATDQKLTPPMVLLVPFIRSRVTTSPLTVDFSNKRLSSIRTTMVDHGDSNGTKHCELVVMVLLTGSFQHIFSEAEISLDYDICCFSD